jgi:hypothetical protein
MPVRLFLIRIAVEECSYEININFLGIFLRSERSFLSLLRLKLIFFLILISFSFLIFFSFLICFSFLILSRSSIKSFSYGSSGSLYLRIKYIIYSLLAERVKYSNSFLSV